MMPLRSTKLVGIAFLALSCFLLAGPQLPSKSRQQRADGTVAVAMQEPSGQATERKRDARPDHGWIGVMLQDDQGHARVADVFPAGPAAFAGVRAGDVVTAVAGATVSSAADATSAIERLAPRQQTTISIERHGKTRELKVIPDSLAEFRDRFVNEMMHRDPRHPKYGEHPGVSATDMQAEVIRRLFEQHERLERGLNEVLKELHELRQEVRALKK